MVSTFILPLHAGPVVGHRIDFFSAMPKIPAVFGHIQGKKRYMSNPAGRSDENPGFRTIFGHHGKNGGFLPKIFDDTRGGNMKLGEHMVGRPENGGSRRNGRVGEWGEEN